MSVVSYQTAIALKGAGLPQPTPQIGQVWYGISRPEIPSLLTWKNLLPRFECITLDDGEPGDQLKSDAVSVGVFAPTLEYIVHLLPIPELFHFEIWNNTPSCRFRDDENPRRTFGDNFAEAAAKMYLELKQNAPTSDFSKMGDVAQE